MKKTMTRFIPFFIMASFLVTGCNQDIKSTTTAAKPAVSTEVKKDQGPVYKGMVVGKSNKAKQISITIGKGKDAKTLMVSFDDKTKGLEHAAKGHGAIIAYEMRAGVPFATIIKPKLVKLPPGVTVISPVEVQTLINTDKSFLLVDSRPGNRYSASHLPGAISIPVCEMQELLQNLPKDKDKLLIFYCGGPT
jgi:predicted small secreted protein